MLKAYLAIMAIGALGCGMRMWITNGLFVKFGSAFPIGTLVVNILGCFLIGVFATLTRAEGGFPISPVLRSVVMIGFLGGFTTFSSFALETLTLINHRAWGHAILNVGLSVLLCLAAVWVGQILALQLASGSE